MAKKDTMLVRVSRKAWGRARIVFPETTDSAISKLVVNAALPRYEQIFRVPKDVDEMLGVGKKKRTQR